MTHRSGCGHRGAGRRDHRRRRADVRRRRRHRVHGPHADREPAREGQRGQGRRPGGRRRSPTSSCRRTTRPTSRSRSTTTSLPCTRDRRSRCARSSLPSVANRYISLHPGPNNARRDPGRRSARRRRDDQRGRPRPAVQHARPQGTQGPAGSAAGVRAPGTWARATTCRTRSSTSAPSLGNLSEVMEELARDQKTFDEPDRERRQGDRRDRRRGATTWPSWSRTGPRFARALGHGERGARPGAGRAARTCSRRAATRSGTCARRSSP